MSEHDTHLRAWITDYNRVVRLTYYHKLPDGKIGVALPLNLHPVEEGDAYEPFILLPHMAAQELMDDLWQCGLRPTEGSGSAGSLAAIERHLRDMRALVFRDDVKAKS